MKNSTYGLQYKESQAIELEGPNIEFKTGELIAHYFRKVVDLISQIRLTPYALA